MLQTYDCTISHVPGVCNPADTLTRKACLENRDAAHHVQDADGDLVDNLRVPETATDEEIQTPLDRVFKQQDQHAVQFQNEDSMEAQIIDCFL